MCWLCGILPTPMPSAKSIEPPQPSTASTTGRIVTAGSDSLPGHFFPEETPQQTADARHAFFSGKGTA